MDRDRRPGRFLLTGPADLLQVKGVGDSLAGRAETVELKPLSQGELARRKTPEDFVAWMLSGASPGRFEALDPAVVVTGGYPEALSRTPQRAHRWFGSYVERLSDHDALSIGGRKYYGALVEQFVALELGKQQGWSNESYSLFHYRDLDGLEVDVIIELADGRLLAIEVKSAASASERAWAGLIRFKGRFPDRDITGICLHAGTQTGTIEGWLHILPITALWQH